MQRRSAECGKRNRKLSNLYVWLFEWSSLCCLISCTTEFQFCQRKQPMFWISWAHLLGGPLAVQTQDEWVGSGCSSCRVQAAELWRSTFNTYSGEKWRSWREAIYHSGKEHQLLRCFTDFHWCTKQSQYTHTYIFRNPELKEKQKTLIVV